MMARTATALLGIASFAPSATLVRDEKTRLNVLGMVFPNARITTLPGKAIDSSFSDGDVAFPDALKNGKVYDVAAPPVGKEEECAATSIPDPETVGQHRLLRFELFSLADRPMYFVVMQYKFSDTEPAFACPSIARLSVVSRGKRVHDFVPEMTHHNGIQTIEFADLDGRGSENFVFESDWGGAGDQSSDLLIFHLESGKLHQLLAIRSRENGYDQEFVRVLDLARTASQGGKKFCFKETDFREGDTVLQPPKIIHPCFPPGATNQ